MGTAQRVAQKRPRIAAGEDQDGRRLPTRGLHHLVELEGTEPRAARRIACQRQALARAVRSRVDEAPLAGLRVAREKGMAAPDPNEPETDPDATESNT